jgi:predicted flap endonuclease-1-like 5' DNA nuclease
MKRVENLNTPSLEGAMVAGGLGIVAFVVSKVVGGFDYTTSGFFAVVIAAVAGIVLVLPWGAKSRIPSPEAVAEPHAAAPAAPAAVAPAAAPVAVAPAAAAPAAAPAPAAPAAASGEQKPAGLSAPRGGKSDDLKVIEGVGPAMEKLLNEHGIYHLDQIAGWGPAEVAWMDGNLKGFKGRVTRDKWVAQAKLIGEVGLEEFLRRAKTNDY